MKKLILITLFCFVVACSFGQVKTFTPFDAEAARVNGNEDEPFSASLINFNVSAGTPSYLAGRLFYDTLEGVLGFMPIIDGPILQIGQENWIWAYNNTGVQIDNGQCVYIDSAIAGTIPVAKLAKADAVATANVIAVCTNDVADGAYGFFTTQGKCNALDTSGFSAGTDLYLSAATAGAVTDTPPAAPNFIVKIGRVITTNATTGSIYVNTMPCGALCDAVFAEDVNIAGEVLIATSTDAGDYKLQVNGDIVADQITFDGRKSGAVNIPYNDYIGWSNSGGTGNDQYIYGLNGAMEFGNGNGTRMKIAATTHNVLIGTTTDDEENRLQVAGSTKFTDGSSAQAFAEVTLADDASIAIDSLFDLDTTVPFGKIVIVNIGNTAYGDFMLRGGAVSTVLVTGVDATNSDSDGSLCVYYDTTNYYIKNRLGGSATFAVSWIGDK